MGVAPWDLLKAHPIWRRWAEMAFEFDQIPQEERAGWFPDKKKKR